MSLDSQLDRSKLERKDRDELATIVTTLGGRPGRSKKSDLVEMILELTRGGDDASESSGRRSRTADEESSGNGVGYADDTSPDGTALGHYASSHDTSRDDTNEARDRAGAGAAPSARRLFAGSRRQLEDHLDQIGLLRSPRLAAEGRDDGGELVAVLAFELGTIELRIQAHSRPLGCSNVASPQKSSGGRVTPVWDSDRLTQRPGLAAGVRTSCR